MIDLSGTYIDLDQLVEKPHADTCDICGCTDDARVHEEIEGSPQLCRWCYLKQL